MDIMISDVDVWFLFFIDILIDEVKE